MKPRVNFRLIKLTKSFARPVVLLHFYIALVWCTLGTFFKVYSFHSLCVTYCSITECSVKLANLNTRWFYKVAKTLQGIEL